MLAESKSKFSRKAAYQYRISKEVGAIEVGLFALLLLDLVLEPLALALHFYSVALLETGRM